MTFAPSSELTLTWSTEPLTIRISSGSYRLSTDGVNCGAERGRPMVEITTEIFGTPCSIFAAPCLCARPLKTS